MSMSDFVSEHGTVVYIPPGHACHVYPVDIADITPTAIVNDTLDNGEDG